jgi:hypothetical protein
MHTRNKQFAVTLCQDGVQDSRLCLLLDTFRQMHHGFCSHYHGVLQECITHALAPEAKDRCSLDEMEAAIDRAISELNAEATELALQSQQPTQPALTPEQMSWKAFCGCMGSGA